MRIIALFLSLFIFQNVSAEQYRSKLFLDPNKQLSESSALSLQDLEKQIDTMTDAYSKSSTGRYLAHHYVNEKNYVKAIEYYNTALASEGLSSIANNVLLKELAGVYVLEKQYENAIKTLKRLTLSLSKTTSNTSTSNKPTTTSNKPTTTSKNTSTKMDLSSQLLLSQAYFGVNDYLAVVETLDNIMTEFNVVSTAGPASPQLTEEQLNLMLGLYYKSGGYQQSEKILQQLINRSPKSLNYWRQLTSILLMQNKNKQALDQLALARQKQLPFRSQDILLLADLYVANQAPEKAARLFEQAIAEAEIENNETNNKRLFEYWLQAREKEKATNTLTGSLKLIENMDLLLRLAQLQMEQEYWQDMNSTMLAACHRVLDDKYVSRANVLLGISQLKLGDKKSARGSFINATLIGGASDKAREWLAYINAERPEGDELKSITGPCRPKNRKVPYVKQRRQLEPIVSKKTEIKGKTNVAAQAEALSVETKTIAAQSLYGIKLSAQPTEIAKVIEKQAVRAGVALVKSGGSINGPLHLLFDEEIVAGEALSFRLAFPYKSKPRNKGPYRAKKADEFKCAYLNYNGPAAEVSAAWAKLYSQVIAAGLTPSGKSRMVLTIDESKPIHTLSFELQMGVL